MSRIGKLPVPIPSGTEVKIGSDGATVTVKGPKGQLSRTLPRVTVALADNTAVVSAAGTARSDRACHGLGRALLKGGFLFVFSCSGREDAYSFATHPPYFYTFYI